MTSLNGDSSSDSSQDKKIKKKKLSIDDIGPYLDSLENLDGYKKNSIASAFNSLNLSFEYYLDPVKFKTIYNTKLSGILAVVLWSTLGLVVACHLRSINSISYFLLTSSVDLDSEVVDKISDVTDSHYSGIYAFLGTLATSITACYFASVGSASEGKND